MGKNPLYWKNSPQRRIEPATLHHAGQRAQHTTNELFWPPLTLVQTYNQRHWSSTDGYTLSSHSSANQEPYNWWKTAWKDMACQTKTIPGLRKFFSWSQKSWHCEVQLYTTLQICKWSQTQNPVTYREAKTLLHSWYNGRLEERKRWIPGTPWPNLETGMGPADRYLPPAHRALRSECPPEEDWHFRHFPVWVQTNWPNPRYVLQSCLIYTERRQLTWPQGADLATKLWGSAEDLYRTVGFVASTALEIWPAQLSIAEEEEEVSGVSDYVCMENNLPRTCKCDVTCCIFISQRRHFQLGKT